MQEFKNNSLLGLFYEIIGWLIVNKMEPKRINFSKSEGLFIANVNYYPKENIGETKEQKHEELTLAEKAMKQRYERTSNKIIGG